MRYACRLHEEASDMPVPVQPAILQVAACLLLYSPLNTTEPAAAANTNIIGSCSK